MTVALEVDDAGPKDADLAAAVAAGDAAAFERLMRRNNRRLFRTARAILGDDAEAEDVLQDTYLIAYRRIGSYRGDARLSTWLTRIAINEALQRMRARIHGDRTTAMDNVIDFEKRLAELHAHTLAAETPERSAMRGETRKFLEKKIDELPVAYRTVFVLRAVEEVDFAEIAASLDIPEATARTRFFRACRMLRKAVSTEFYTNAREAFFFEGAQCDRVVTRLLAQIPAQPTRR